MGDYYAGFSETKIRIITPPRHMAPNLEPKDDINPSDPAPIFRTRAEGDGLEMVTARWWFVPSTYKGPFKEYRKKQTTFNARSETAATLRTFKEAYATRRCLIPADGWYEWTGEKYPKTKWLFERSDREWFCFAGLWSRFTDSADGPIETFTMLTQDSSEHLAEYHNRRPIALERAGCEDWILHGDRSAVIPPTAIAANYSGGPRPVS